MEDDLKCLRYRENEVGGICRGSEADFSCAFGYAVGPSWFFRIRCKENCETEEDRRTDEKQRTHLRAARRRLYTYVLSFHEESLGWETR